MNPLIGKAYLFGGILVLDFTALVMLMLMRKYIPFLLLLIFSIALIVYYAIKYKISFLSPQQQIEEMRFRNAGIREEADLDMDIDDIKNNPALRKEILKRGYPDTKKPLTWDRLHGHVNEIKSSQPKKCSSCGNIMMGDHQYCMSCGSKI